MARGKKTPKLCDEIVARISAGEPLSAICSDKHMPIRQAVYQWIDADEDFASRFARARELGHDVLAEGALSLAEEMPERGPDGRIDLGYVAWQKNRVWTRLQLLAKWSPKYSDKMQFDITAKTYLINTNAQTDDEWERTYGSTDSVASATGTTKGAD